MALKDWQRRTAEARAALLHEVDRIAAVVGREKAITKVVIMAQDGTLPEHLAQLVPLANARAGANGRRTLSRRTIYDWYADARRAADGGRMDVNALAPRDPHAYLRIPAWAAPALQLYQRPQKPSLKWVLEQLPGALPAGIEAPSYFALRRFLQKVGNVELQAGRMGSRDIKNIKPFIRRDTSMLWPADVYTADGHTFDAEIAHPAHGRPFRPEITTVADIATRRIVGWSIDLAESGLAVLDALRHACEIGGIPTTFYVDNGSGYKNALMSAPGIGMSSRLGFTMTHSIAYNSQARGIIERLHQTVWVRAARELPTYIGATMDAQAKQKVHKLTRRDIAVAGSSRHLMPFNAFIDFCEKQVRAYNARPHRGLPMVSDPALGRRRHMSPDEAWAQGVADGAQLVMLTSDEARDLFRPQREAKVLRGEIRLFGNQYFSQELTEFHGDIVRVAYDVHDAGRVWVYDRHGRFVCEAGFEANKRAYFPESFLEQAARKRAEGRAQRLEVKLQEVRDEHAGAPLTIENNPTPTLHDLGFGALNTPREEVAVLNLDTPASLDLASHEEEHLTAPDNSQSGGPARPIFELESDRYEWLMQHRDGWNDADQRFLQQFVDGDIYQALQERFEALGLSWDGGNEVFKRAV
ncbi:MAG: Mu transposase C-terminal domain-containing protein [Burkholderiaceae bacterium]